MLNFIAEELDTIEDVQLQGSIKWDRLLLQLQVISCNLHSPMPQATWREFCENWVRIWMNISRLSLPQLRLSLTLWISALPRIVDEVRQSWNTLERISAVKEMVSSVFELICVVLFVGLPSLDRSVQLKLSSEGKACVVVGEAIMAKVQLLLSFDNSTLSISWEAVDMAIEIVLRIGSFSPILGRKIGSEAVEPTSQLLSLAAALRDSITAHVSTFADNATRMFVLSDFMAQKWDSSARFFGGKVPTHSIPMVFLLCANLVRQSAVIIPSKRASVASSLAVGSLLRAALKGVAQFLSHLSPSQARRPQLLIDVMYLTRITRMFRDIVAERCGTLVSTLPYEIHTLLLQCLGRTAVLSDGDAEGNAGLCTEQFHSIVWNVPPVSPDELNSASLAELSMLSASFIRYVSHVEMCSVRFPSRNTPVAAFGCLTPVGSVTLSDIASAVF